MVITRGSILREVLIEKEDLMYRYSKYRAGLTALEGYEQLFEDLKKTCELLRGMIRNADEREHEEDLMKFARENREALQHPEIQQRLAEWQMELIRGKKPGVEWADQAPPPNMTWDPIEQKWKPMMTPDEVVLRRRHQKAEGFKPEPVIYPGGEE